jgi:UDP-2,3-diacylglucosamine hydrolase
MLSKLVIIAGSGDYPRLLVEGAKKAGVAQVDVVAIAGSTSRATRNAADHVIPITISTIAENIRRVGTMHYDGAILAGQVNPLSLFRGRFDREVQSWLDELPVKTAHTVFSKLVEKFAESGITILPASLFMDDNLPGVGPLTTRDFTEEERSDIQHAMRVAHDVGVHDVGQTVMVKKGMVLAVEAFEGTNRAIRRGGRLGGRGSVLFKAAREGHDMRFDIPVIGLKTLKTMRRAGVTALGFQASRLIVLNREDVIAYANKHNIAIVGVDSGLPPAPLRP